MAPILVPRHARPDDSDPYPRRNLVSDWISESPKADLVLAKSAFSLFGLVQEPLPAKSAGPIPMTDLKSSRLIYFKGWLFLAGGFTAVGLVMAEHPDLKTGVLLAISIWCFCRFYYFAFYVIQHYVDDQFRFAGLFDFAMYLLKRKR